MSNAEANADASFHSISNFDAFLLSVRIVHHMVMMNALAVHNPHHKCDWKTRTMNALALAKCVIGKQE